MDKLEPCCARRASQVINDQQYLRRLASRAAYAASKGRSTVKVVAEIDKTKIELANSKQAQIDHDADHAAERVPA